MIVCDKCGTPLNIRTIKIRTEEDRYPANRTFDLCYPCYEKLCAWVREKEKNERP